jgi:polyvinyl alcohol dehydrogenase (cytochrome)
MDVNTSNPSMFALDGGSGQVLWSYAPGGSVVAAPAIVGNAIYWGAGYGRFGSPIAKLFAFSISSDDE